MAKSCITKLQIFMLYIYIYICICMLCVYVYVLLLLIQKYWHFSATDFQNSEEDLDGSLLFEEHSTKSPKSNKNVQLKERRNAYVILATTNVKLRHSCNAFKDIEEYTQNRLRKVPGRRIHPVKFFFAHWL